MPKSSTTAVPPSSLTTTFSMIELDQLCVRERAVHDLAGFDGDQDRCITGIEAVTAAVHERPGRHDAADDMARGAGAGDVRERPAGRHVLSHDLPVELVWAEGDGVARVGARATRGGDVKVGRDTATDAVEVEGAVATQGRLVDGERGIRGVGERAGRGIPARDDRAHGGVARIEAEGGARGEGAADAGADGDLGADGEAHDVRERPAGLGRSWTSFIPSWRPLKTKGALVVGLATAVLRVNGRARCRRREVEGRGAAHGRLLDVEQGVPGVGVRAGHHIPGQQVDAGEAGGQGGRALRADQAGEGPPRDRQDLPDCLGAGRVGAHEGEREGVRGARRGIVVEEELPPWKSVPPPVPVVANWKSWSELGTASLVTVMVASPVFVNVQVGASPPVMTARTVVSPGSKPRLARAAKLAPMPVPMIMPAPTAKQTMFVSVQPASGAPGHPSSRARGR